MKQSLLLFSLVFLLFACGGGGSNNVTSGEIPSPGDEEETKKIKEIIGLFFLSSNSTDTSRYQRTISSNIIALMNNGGVTLQTTKTDLGGKFTFTGISKINDEQFPLKLVTQYEGQTYSSVIPASSGNSETLTSHINQITTAIVNYVANVSIMTQERLDVIALLVMSELFGVNQLGNLNIPPNLFINSDFESTNSLGNLLLNAAVRSGIDLSVIPDNRPLLTDPSYVASLTIELQNLADTTSVLESLSQQPGSSNVLAPLSRLSRANTTEEIDLYQTQLLTEMNGTLDELNLLRTALQTTISQNPVAPETPELIVVESLQIVGGSEMNEVSSSTFTITAQYNNGIVEEVVPFWKLLGGGGALVDDTGTITSGFVTGNQSFTLVASYGGRTTTKIVTIIDNDAYLVSLVINGVDEINESATSQFTATATYSDGTTQTVQPTWTDNTSYLVVDGTGLVTTSIVNNDQTLKIFASFNGVTTDKSITIKDLTKSLTSIEITGCSIQMDEESTMQCQLTAFYDDSSQEFVTPTWSLQSNGIATIDSKGNLIAYNVSGNQTIKLIASYGGLSTDQSIIIQDLTRSLNGIQIINCDSEINEQTTMQCQLTASYDDGSQETVTPTWSIPSGYASIDSAGIVTSHDVSDDQTIQLVASYGGLTTNKNITIQKIIASRLWVLGGTDGDSFKNDVWSSIDGITWTQTTGNAGWSGRRQYQSLSFNQKIWILGGDAGSYNGDVWFSPDGQAWTQVTTNPGWDARTLSGSAVFQNKMWIFGGRGVTDNFGRFGDVWSSTDGQTWTFVTGNPGWEARHAFGSTVFDGKLWLMGGNCCGGQYTNDVWSSEDGESWVEVTEGAGWAEREITAVVPFNGKLWAMGGFNDDGYLNDVWSSTNGQSWTLETSDPGWSGRDKFAAVVHDNKIWVIGGRNEANLNDVWSSSDGRTWTKITNTPGWDGRYGLDGARGP
ncbi:MAG: hypothetical protein HQM14_18495 [SAR324 cluster bacterium]|nr:hypothetical protein [SAR324 cluster bacterium]